MREKRVKEIKVMVPRNDSADDYEDNETSDSGNFFIKIEGIDLYIEYSDGGEEWECYIDDTPGNMTYNQDIYELLSDSVRNKIACAIETKQGY